MKKHCDKCSYETDEGISITGCSFCGCHNPIISGDETKKKKDYYIKDSAEFSNFAQRVERKPELTKEESDVYIKIVSYGTMDDMFDFAYAIGRERFAKEQLIAWREMKRSVWCVP